MCAIQWASTDYYDHETNATTKIQTILSPQKLPQVLLHYLPLSTTGTRQLLLYIFYSIAFSALFLNEWHHTISISCVLILLLRIILRSMHAVLWISSSFFISEYYSVVKIYHISLIHSQIFRLCPLFGYWA